MVAMPLVSVVMPVYNAEKYLESAIESILKQTFQNFEFIIINDGSTDGSEIILKKYGQIDARIRLCRSKHQGISPSLNMGCNLAQGKYIVRMDADDISFPERIAKEVEYMDAHPEIGILGTAEELIDKDGKVIGKKYFPALPGFIKWSIILGGWCISHPTVMMRRDVVEPLHFYRDEIFSGQDYDLWSRAIFVTQITNIPDILLQRRIWAGNHTFKDHQANTQTVIKAMHLAIRRLLERGISEEIITGILQLERNIPLKRGIFPKSSQHIKSISTALQQLYSTYIRTNSLSRIEATKVSQDVQKKLRTLTKENF